MKDKLINLHKHRCKQCGKEFECYSAHVYKIPTNKYDTYSWFCSYKCIQAYRKDTRKKPNDKERLILEMLDAHSTVKNITETLRVSKETVYKVKDEWRNAI